MSVVDEDGAAARAASGRHDAGIPDRPRSRPRPHGLSLTVLVIGLVVTAALAVVSRLNYAHNEQHQVSTQAQLAGAALTAAPIDIQRLLGRPTTSVAASGDLGLFDSGMKRQVPKPFVSAQLFRMVDGSPHLVRSLGKSTQLDTSSGAARTLLGKAASSATPASNGTLVVTRLATATTQRLGYAFAATALGRTYVAYAEQTLPGDRREVLKSGSPLADMDFALYYGKRQTSSTLVETNTDDLPITGTLGRVTIPFGDQVLTAVMTPRSPLLGTFAQSIAWMIAAAGLLLTAVVALLTERLLRRRAVAEQLAAVTDQLYRAERGVAETLQTALLPKHLPRPPGLAIATRYLGGTEGINVGGDWYDVVDLPGDRIFFTIGDVSGRGLSAATTMSRLRHSITAYAVEGNDPAMVLTKVSGLIDVVRDGHFATALCGILDLGTGIVTVANAGHLPLLRKDGLVVEPIEGPLGPPLGVGSQYDTADITLTPGTVVLAYTDGLVERRDESIDVGIARLCRVASTATDLETLLDTVVTGLLDDRPSTDDAAIMGVQWNP